MKRMLLTILSAIALILAFPVKALAVCPLCTLAVGAGVGFSQWLGIDDAITGVWIGGLIVSMIVWTENWLESKNIRFKGRLLLNSLGYYALIVIPMYYSGLITNPANLTQFGLDKLLFGIVAGSIAFLFGASWYFYLKEKNNGHAYFPFQKVVMPVAPLVLLSILFYFLTL
jgi:hypothetical protein